MAVAIGNGALATSSVAVGVGAQATGGSTVAVGDFAVASGQQSTAIGANAQAVGYNSVALGGGSIANQNNTVSVGTFGGERRITNVASGIAPSDAATMGQLNGVSGQLRHDLNDVRKGANQGVAAVAAMLTCVRTPSPGKSTISVGGGYYGGQAGMALAMAHRSRDSRWQAVASLGVPASMVSGQNIAAAGGVGFEF